MGEMQSGLINQGIDTAMNAGTMPASSVLRLQQYDHIFAPHHQEIVDWLAIAQGSQVLDAGCGAGGTTALLAAAAGARGRVAALDVKAEHVAATREAVADAKPAAPVTLHECSLLDMPFSAGAFDLVWCSRVVHHMPDQLSAARALVRAAKPGGRVALREGGITSRFLPFDCGVGEPGLEARLQVIHDRWFTHHVRGGSAAHTAYPYGWAQLLRDAGCENVGAKSFLFEAASPLSAELMEYGLTLLRSRLTDPEIAPTLTPGDKQTIEALTDEHSPHYVARRNDLHWLSVSSVYLGWVPG